MLLPEVALGNQKGCSKPGKLRGSPIGTFLNVRYFQAALATQIAALTVTWCEATSSVIRMADVGLERLLAAPQRR